MLPGTAGPGAHQQAPQAEEQQAPARPADEEMGEGAAAAAMQQPTATSQPEEGEDGDIDIMSVSGGGRAAQATHEVPAAEPLPLLCSTVGTGGAPQPDPYDFDSEAPDAGPSARPCPATQHSGLPNGHAAQQAHAGASSGAPAPEQKQPLLSATVDTDVKDAQPGAQPDQAVPAADAQATVRTSKRSRSVFGGEANLDGPHKAAKTLGMAAPRQALQADGGLTDAMLAEAAAKSGHLWQNVSPHLRSLCFLKILSLDDHTCMLCGANFCRSQKSVLPRLRALVVNVLMGGPDMVLKRAVLRRAGLEQCLLCVQKVPDTHRRVAANRPNRVQNDVYTPHAAELGLNNSKRGMHTQ